MKRSIRLISAPGRPLPVICLIVLIGCIGTATAFARWHSLLTLDVRPSYLSHEFFVGPAGDLNGDAFDDFFVGDPNFNLGQGYLKIIYGSECPDTIAGWFAQIPNVHPSCFGAWAKVINDMDGDDFDEIIVGAPLYAWHSGRVFLYSTNPLDTTYDQHFSGGNEGFGAYHASGDFNGDRYNDLLIGEGAYQPFISRASAYLFLGSSEIDANPDWIYADSTDLPVQHFRMKTGSGGDFNADGYDDFSVFEDIYYGDIDSFFYEDNLFLGNAEIDFIPLITTDIHVRWMGDLNNDGMADFKRSWDQNDTLHIKLYYGNTDADTFHTQELYNHYFESGELLLFTSPFGDFNNDSFDDILILRGPDPENRYGFWAELWYGGAELDTIPDEIFGIPYLSAIVNIGDINGNGTGEIMVRQRLANDSTSTSIFTQDPSDVSNDITMSQNPNIRLYVFPNPFNSSTIIRFSLEAESYVELTVFDILGRQVDRLVDGYLTPGYHQVEWDAGDHPSGVYFYRLIMQDTAVTGRMTLLR